MSGHAILDSCHNCGASGVKLHVVSVVSDCSDPDVKHPHIHVFVACDKCKQNIWEKDK